MHNFNFLKRHAEECRMLGIWMKNSFFFFFGLNLGSYFKMIISIINLSFFN